MILITGCAGFIGSHLCLSYLNDDYDVIGIDNFDPYYDVFFKKNNLKLLTSYKRFRFKHLDITDEKRVSKLFQISKLSAVVHLAARPGVAASLVDPLPYEKINIYGTLVLLEQMKNFPKTPFIFSSSSSVYGAVSEIPFREDMEINKQLSPYGASKWASEGFCRLYHDLYDISVTILRLFTVYGPRVRPDMAIYKFIKKIIMGESLNLYNDGEVERDYTYIDDIVAGIRLAEKNKFPYEVINLGNSNPIKIKYLVTLLEKNLGKKANRVGLLMPKSEMKRTYASIIKAKNLLGWEPSVSIEEGVEKFVKWYQKSIR